MSSTSTSFIPHSPDQLNEHVKLNLNLGLKDKFQGVHIEIGQGYSYTIIAKFEGGESGSSFNIKKIDFKLIPISGINQGIHINSVTFSEEDGGIKKFTLSFAEFQMQDGESEDDFEERMKNHTATFETPTTLDPTDIFDIHIDDEFYDLALISKYVLGRQCNSYIMY